MVQILRYLSFAVIVLLWTTLSVQAQGPGKLTADIRLSSHSISWDDPLYVSIKLKNETGQPIVLPAKAWLLTVNCKMKVTISESSSSYPIRCGLCMPMVRSKEQTLAQGEFLSDIKVIEIPDEDHKSNQFWTQLAKSPSFFVEVTFPAELISNNETKIEVQLRQRPQQEQELITKLKAMVDPYQPPYSIRFDADTVAWHPYSTLSYLSIPISEEHLLVDEFLKVREKFSAGSFKNGLLMIHQLQEITDRHGKLSDAERQKRSDDLLKWLEGLNPVEAKYLADRYQSGFTSRISSNAHQLKGDQVFTNLNQKLLEIAKREFPSAAKQHPLNRFIKQLFLRVPYE